MSLCRIRRTRSHHHIRKVRSIAEPLDVALGLIVGMISAPLPLRLPMTDQLEDYMIVSYDVRQLLSEGDFVESKEGKDCHR